MTQTCGGCSCQVACTTESSGKLLLATQVAHTVKALRSLAAREGLQLELLAPGLLALQTDHADALIAEACTELSSVEADEVHCLVLDTAGVSGASVIARAMSAPSLSAAGARVVHADLLPLFDDEERYFHAVYQPIVTLADRRTVAHEALLRAELPDGRPVFPDVLFPAAEAAGWIHLLDRVGRTTAIRDAGAWLGDGLLFVNFIPTSIYRPEVCLRTTELAAVRAGVRLDQLVFEVTEGHQVEDIDHLEQVFDYYRSRKCKVALDDLGSGYSSLNMLVRLHPDVVKLDKELVQGLPGAASRAVVAAIVQIAHSYGGLVLAECVETSEQGDAALELGVDLGQGWLYGRPERPTPSSTDLAHAVAAPGPVRVKGDPSRPDRAVAVGGAADDEEINGIIGRSELLEVLEATQTIAQRDRRAMAVLSLELDGFAVATDNLDGAVGDKLLQQVADRIQAVIRSGDRLAHTGGNEFVAVLADLDPIDAARIADRVGSDVLADLQRPFTLGSARTVLRGSVGVSIFPDQATTSASLLAGAGTARREAKRVGDRAVGS
jgi:diguanylate cyclase (GGDEF)-like protein